jgi:hypothetical protein
LKLPVFGAFVSLGEPPLAESTLLFALANPKTKLSEKSGNRDRPTSHAASLSVEWRQYPAYGAGRVIGRAARPMD